MDPKDLYDVIGTDAVDEVALSDYSQTRMESVIRDCALFFERTEDGRVRLSATLDTDVDAPADLLDAFGVYLSALLAAVAGLANQRTDETTDDADPPNQTAVRYAWTRPTDRKNE